MLSYDDFLTFTSMTATLSDKDTSAARRWVDRYFVPVLASASAEFSRSTLSCLHFGSPGNAECDFVRQAGHECRVAVLDNLTLKAPSATFDVVFGGSFGRIAQSLEARQKLASELDRVAKKDAAAVLLTVANSRSCIDLSGNARIVHAPGDRRCVHLDEIHELFIHSGRFRTVRLLPLRSQFGWTQLPGILGGLRPLFERYVSWSSDTGTPARYAGPLNPVMNLWIAR